MWFVPQTQRFGTLPIRNMVPEGRLPLGGGKAALLRSPEHYPHEALLARTLNPWGPVRAIGVANLLYPHRRTPRRRALAVVLVVINI